VLDSDHYPALEALGGISVEVDEGSTAIAEISGFDGVIEFGGIGNPFARGGEASVGYITGFNSVERIDGSLMASARITGFSSLREVVGDVYVSDLSNAAGLERIGGSLLWATQALRLRLPSLQEVGGDLTIQASAVTEVGFPSLTRIGGNLVVYGNGTLTAWLGLAQGSVIRGSFEAAFNRPIADHDFQSWLDGGQTTVQGTTRICANGPQVEGEEKSCNGY
jgi:hypothetical protein